MEYDDYVKLQTELKKYAKAYYLDDEPLVSDAEYDALYHKALDMEKEHPDWITVESISQVVGFGLQDKFNKGDHIYPMTSMEDIFEASDLENWFKKWSKVLPNLAITAEPKFDGLSLNVLYSGGRLKKAQTRGDGKQGEDVTMNALQLDIPKTIEYKGNIEIRGEVVMTFKSFDSANKDRVQEGKSEFANPRNAAAGSLRNLDPEVTKKRNLKFIPWGIGSTNLVFDSHSEIREFLADQGFYENKLILEPTQEFNDLIEFYNTVLNSREKLEYAIDGIAYKMNQTEYQEQAGFTNKFPRWQQAFKFPAEEKVTKLKGITVQIGTTGNLTPVAELEPIEIDGSVVQRATLHNYDIIAARDFRIGDQVVLYKSGDIIPALLKPLQEKRTGEEIKIEIPENCPVCTTVTEVIKNDKGNTRVICPNDNCKGRLSKRLQSFESKKKMNIDGLGESVAEALSGSISNVFGIYNLDVAFFEGLPGFKKKKET